MDSINIAKRVFNIEIECSRSVCDNLNETFNSILKEIMNCEGKIIMTGMGKSGHVARKIAATLSSLGSCSIFLHPGECMHGDLGMIQSKDLVIAISYSGESDEIIKIIPSIRIIGAKLIGITSNENSTLAKNSCIVQILSGVREACSLGLAPTTSTTVTMMYGDALAVAAAELKGFQKEDFGIFHPAGSLGKKLTIRVIDLMNHVSQTDIVNNDSTIIDAVLAFINVQSEILPVMDTNDLLIGIISKYDVEQIMRDKVDIYEKKIDSIVNRYPIYVDCDTMAIDALKLMIDNSIQALPVVKQEKAVGILSKDSILKAGIYV